MLAALLAAVVFLWQREETAPIEPEEVNNRVAVEDFENRTGDISLDSLGSMAADWITQGLSELGMIEVVPAATAPAEAGTLVTGNYYVQGDTIVFQSNVMDVEEGTILYSLKPVSGSRDSPMDVMEDLRQRVMGALAFRFVPPRFIDTRLYTPPFNMEAYQEFIAGTEYFGVDYARAMRHLERASEVDPDFILPRAWLVSALGNQGQWTEAEAQLRILYENREQANRWERLWIDQEMAKIEGNYAEANQILGQLDELDPRNRNTKYLLGLQALR